MDSYKWWRIINIVQRRGDMYSKSVTELQFIDANNVNLATDPSKAFSASSWSSSYLPSNAFDGNTSSYAYTAEGITFQESIDWYIGYEFDEPVKIKYIAVLPWQSMRANYGQEWQSARIQVSNNGSDWKFYGFILPFVKQMDLSLHKVEIINSDSLNINNIETSSEHLDIANNHGRITANVTELGLPIGARVTLFDRLTNRPVAIKYSDDKGIVVFNGHNENREYFLHAVHPKRKDNAVTQDMIPGNYDKLKASGYYDTNN